MLDEFRRRENIPAALSVPEKIGAKVIKKT